MQQLTNRSTNGGPGAASARGPAPAAHALSIVLAATIVVALAACSGGTPANDAAPGGTDAPTTAPGGARSTATPAATASRSTTPVQVGTVVGRWVVADGFTFLRIEQDGTWAFADHPDREGFDGGSWSLTDGVLTLTTEDVVSPDTGRDVACPAGTTGEYRVSLEADGQALSLSHLTDSCLARGQLLPAGPVRVGSDAEPAAAPGPATDTMVGTWMIPGHQRYLLTFAPDGSWRIAEDFHSVDFETGTWEQQGSTVTMVSGPRALCPEGSIGTYELVLRDDGRTATGSLVEDECEGRVEGQVGTWRRLGS